jgi:hypothetical protein
MGVTPIDTLPPRWRQLSPGNVPATGGSFVDGWVTVHDTVGVGEPPPFGGGAAPSADGVPAS